LAATVDFPTPPLPLATAMVYFTWGISAWPGARAAAGAAAELPPPQPPALSTAARA